ncbi:hypothetical protein M011DRAFT_468400 [Sporormia fimetaria CBS 119925]|uniref:HIG1 domain-containing protein n=1 Tax=Sporormia fimetaria CBS 119925 TaxID=1340428 RepID=A0A6A6V9Y9_9PLEO|nr:hypothetical protein M011DRAFT_468400 [Sporormia fimetaria CBS 119925]
MKVLTKEEEQAHYNATIKGGIMGGVVGLAIGGVGLAFANKRYAAVRSLTTPFKAFLVSSSGTFAAVIAADRASVAYDVSSNPRKQQELERERAREAALTAGKTTLQRAREWAEENRYPIIFAFWLLSLGGSFAIVNRNPYLSSTQKLVQARVYAQGSTLAVLLASFAVEANDANKGKGRWETIKVIDPNDPEHKHLIEKRIHHERYPGEDQWREMVEAEEARMKARKEAAKGRVEAAEKQEKHADEKQASANAKDGDSKASH